MSWKKLIFGQPVPDRDDPKYKEKYEQQVDAGRRFADASGISWFARRSQQWGQSHKVLFLLFVFAFVISSFFFNVYRMVSMYQKGSSSRAVAVERVDSAMQHRYDFDED